MSRRFACSSFLSASFDLIHFFQFKNLAVYRSTAIFVMYVNIHFFDNSCMPGEKKVNPHNMAITPGMIDQLTQEGKATCMHALDGSLYYPELGDDVMPLEFERGVDENDAWEASTEAQEKIKKFHREHANAPKTREE